MVKPEKARGARKELRAFHNPSRSRRAKGMAMAVRCYRASFVVVRYEAGDTNCELKLCSGVLLSHRRKTLKAKTRNLEVDV